MENTTELIERLYSKDNKTAYQALQMLETKSQKSNTVYKFFDKFAEMLENSNSYIRTRGIILISANAKWDTENKIDEIIDDYLKHILDEKPITARQCIKALPSMAGYKSDLVECIREALIKADVSIYGDSMQTLVYKDILSSLKKIK
ncbi:SufBD protein [Clostridium sporogenes]|uniref:SufBD protein n=1 Tax=Clostridium botulinum TaxID=1491 RepID=A0A6M0SVD0_CLOBO|nr:SufBD protein [Clostridium sporogenes]NFA59103.1 SufBD protein [Clostridium botulinum]NFI73057.1 SufBD protein [Clostridium sporogenes]NFL71293.1 SufBD protein [Clostridium sporogenes]NFM23097.1 SufBD protein [Clostridium sporogenes]NFP60469.1 SufBD protein [Clostridium sporogenes]